MRKILYGGAITGREEERAIIRSIKKSRKTKNWQAGEEAALMEKEAAEYLGVRHCVLTSSGSCAGLLALSALELPRGSEVIISAVTFPTIFNIILQCGLVPVVVDADVGTYNMDLDEVEGAMTKKTKAVIAIHALGNPVDMPRLLRIVKKSKQKIYVIEDNCDGWGGMVGNKKVGSFGDVSITSFHAAHIVSMGAGGGAFTNDGTLYQRIRMYRDWGRQADINRSENKKWKTLPKDYNPRFIYEKIGYNFQTLELQAAMGRVQLRKTEEVKRKRQHNFDWLWEHLREYCDPTDKKNFLLLPFTNWGWDICWFAFPLSYFGDRGKLLKHLEARGIETRPMFSGNITRHPAYKNARYRKVGKLKNADWITGHSFWISCHPRLTNDDLKYIDKAFADFFGDRKAS